MASERRRSSGTFTIFLACAFFGIFLGALFNPLAAQLRLAVASIPNLRPDIVAGLASAEPLLSEAAMGLVLFGLGSYLIVRLSFTGLVARMLGGLSASLKAKGLLTYHFEAKKSRRRHRDYQEGVLFLLDSYVDKLAEAHADAEKYKAALMSYADPTVQQRLQYETDQHQIKSGKRNVAVLFSDIRGFTAMSEKMLPEEVVTILNDYFSFSTDAINRNKGKVNKFIGDAVMALFEDPPAYQEGESAAKNAINAAISMVENFHAAMPRWKDKISSPFTCDIGVGVHYGEAILGNLGSNERMEYTAIGDTVNFSSRLCSLAKGGQVRVSESCFERVQDAFDGQVQEPVAVKGKTGLHSTYVVSRRRRFTL
jgi:class 3 adenylate cyclase